MNKYQDGKIYKLVSPHTPLVYYGSTIKQLCKRLSEHKCKGSNKCSSNELVKLGDVRIELIENFPCNNKRELEARESIYIKFMLNNFDFKIILNTKIPFRSVEDDIKWRKKYNKKYGKKYREEHPEYNKEYATPEYYAKNRKRLLEKLICECGVEYARSSLFNHKKSKKHQAYVSQLEHDITLDNL